MKIAAKWLTEHNWFLRTSDDGVSYGGFRRKRIGAWNIAPNWTGAPTCNDCGGFYGIDDEANKFCLMPRSTVELCEWRGERVVIDDDKICVREYRVVAINADIPDEAFAACGHQVLRDGAHANRIDDGQWIVLGGRIGAITGGVQWFFDGSTAGSATITGGEQRFHAGSTACSATITGGVQWFFDRSTAGSATISGGEQWFFDRSTAGSATIIGDDQRFYAGSTAGSATITGGVQQFYDGSTAGSATIIGGEQRFFDRSTARSAAITGGEQWFCGTV